MNKKKYEIMQHIKLLKTCKKCSEMIGPVITGEPVMSPILLVGQAPGDKEGVLGRPFAWTAGKTMFKWFSEIGVDERNFRDSVYMAAVCRCFPGKNPKGGDRVPSIAEIENCSHWLHAEIALLKPHLIIPVGKLAIQQFINIEKLADVIGSNHQINYNNLLIDVIPLPHPSGASTWHRKEPGKSLLVRALTMINKHPAWKNIQKKYTIN